MRIRSLNVELNILNVVKNSIGINSINNATKNNIKNQNYSTDKNVHILESNDVYTSPPAEIASSKLSRVVHSSAVAATCDATARPLVALLPVTTLPRATAPPRATMSLAAVTVAGAMPATAPHGLGAGGGRNEAW